MSAAARPATTHICCRRWWIVAPRVLWSRYGIRKRRMRRKPRGSVIAGAGAVGAKSLPHGAPLQVDGLVRFADRVVYRRDRKYMTGQLIDLGCVAVLDVAGVLIVLTTERAMPFDTQHLRAVGIDPAQAKIISMKCGSNWSVAFGDIAAAHFYIDTPGVTSSDVIDVAVYSARFALFPARQERKLAGRTPRGPVRDGVTTVDGARRSRNGGHQPAPAL